MKTYAVQVGTRNRITVPFDCWMDAKCGHLKMFFKNQGLTVEWDPGVGLQKNMSYRVAMNGVKRGDVVILTPNPSKKEIFTEIIPF